MKTFVRILLGAQLVLILVPFAAAQTLPAVPDKATPTEKPRVFITDSQSWEMRGSAGGANGAFGAQTHGGARPQTAEIIKTFGERCPTAMVNNRQEAADYIVLLDHEGGKGLLSHKNKVAVFEKVSGDVVVSHSTLSLGGSVQEACEALTKHWNEHGTQLRAASNVKVAPISQVPPELNKAAVIQPKLNVVSVPDGADIEIDGAFVGSTPSAVEVSSGDHQVVVKKSGYKSWERKLKVTGGDVRINAELEQLPKP